MNEQTGVLAGGGGKRTNKHPVQEVKLVLALRNLFWHQCGDFQPKHTNLSDACLFPITTPMSRLLSGDADSETPG